MNFTFRAAPAQEYDRHDVALRKRIVAEAYAGMGWRAPEFIAAYQEHPAPYFDPLTNVRLAGWSRGRVALLGDAASAAALLGDGSSMAIAGAHVLSQALAAHPDDPARAFRLYEANHRREVEKRQRRVGLLASLMVPRTRYGLAVRNAVARAAGFRHSRPTQHTEPASTAGSSQPR